MDIECKLHREGGTHVKIENTEYHFAPLPDGAHVAAVESDAHADRFLSISEAYKMYRGQAAAQNTAKTAMLAGMVQAPVTQSETHDTVLGSDQHPASFEINGSTHALADVVALAITASGLTVVEWNDLASATRADLIDHQLDKLQADQNGDGSIDSTEERAALALQYEAKHGKKPHYNLNIDKLRAAVAG